MSYRCPECGGPTAYKTFSGGREWDCTDYEGCGADGTYPEGEEPRRAGLLRTEAGRVALGAEMDQELARRRDGGK